MATKFQDHIHLSPSIGGSPEFAPDTKYVLYSRSRVPSFQGTVKRTITGLLRVHTQKDPTLLSSPIKPVNFEIEIKLTDNGSKTAYEQYLDLEALLAEKILFFVENYHPDDGEDHTNFIKKVYATSVGPFRSFGPGFVSGTVPITLVDTWRGNAMAQFIVSDSFTTDEPAPLTSPRNAEPTGTVVIQDTQNNWSIASENLEASANTFAMADPSYASQLQTRKPGIALYAKVRQTNAFSGAADGTIVSWAKGQHSTTLADHEGFLLDTTIKMKKFGDTSFVEDSYIPFSPDVDTEITLILKTQGSYLLVNDQLIRIYNNDATASLYAHVMASGALKQPPEMKRFNVVDMMLSGYLDWIDNRYAKHEFIDPIDNFGVGVGSPANHIYEIIWTPESGESILFDYGLFGSIDQYQLELNESAVPTKGNTVKLYRNGGNSELESAAHTFSAGTTYNIHLHASKTIQKKSIVYVDGVEKFTRNVINSVSDGSADFVISGILTTGNVSKITVYEQNPPLSSLEQLKAIKG
ncbi:MAG: hypothetical protein CUN55_00560 [Phototrophicales bacterium]|nr:MAG: hypothetical protein CUN55_00560 [Phototrophicales bacterium]